MSNKKSESLGLKLVNVFVCIFTLLFLFLMVYFMTFYQYKTEFTLTENVYIKSVSLQTYTYSSFYTFYTNSSYVPNIKIGYQSAIGEQTYLRFQNWNTSVVWQWKIIKYSNSFLNYKLSGQMMKYKSIKVVNIIII